MVQSASLWHCPTTVGDPSSVTLPDLGIEVELIALIVTKRTTPPKLEKQDQTKYLYVDIICSLQSSLQWKQ